MKNLFTIMLMVLLGCSSNMKVATSTSCERECVYNGDDRERVAMYDGLTYNECVRQCEQHAQRREAEVESKQLYEQKLEHCIWEQVRLSESNGSEGLSHSSVKELYDDVAGDVLVLCRKDLERGRQSHQKASFVESRPSPSAWRKPAHNPLRSDSR